MLMSQPVPADQVLRHANPSTTEPAKIEVQSSLDAIVSPEPCHRSMDDLDDPRAILERPTSDQEKRTRMSRLFSRAASNDDLQRIVDMLSNFRSWIDVEASLEEDGITPLIYAACFGHTAVIFMLLDAGAQIDARDNFGWTALIWATNNKHEHIVRLLLEHGASPAAQTLKGRTVADFLRHDPNDNTRIVEIFRRPSHRNSIDHQACDQGADKILLEDKWPYRITRGATGEADAFETVAARRKSATGQVDDTEDFNWETCLPDQMFVFSSGDINRLIKTTITAMETTRSGSFEPVPAYVLFLAARFAHHYSTPDLLDELLEAALSAIEFVTKCKTGDVAFIAYWISNTSVLLCLLRKDPGLDATSKIHQPKFEALLQDMIQMLIMEAEGGIDRILGPAMLEHDTIVGLDEVKFPSDWALGFWKAGGQGHIANRTYKRASAPQFNSPTPPCHPQRRTSMHIPRPLPPSQQSVAPRAVTIMLSSILYLMRSFDIHPEVVHYVVEQLLHYISCEIFNHMMENRRFLSRSKALQTRLNLSCLEDWLRNNQMPSRVSAQLVPLIQLLQLLQVLSQQTDLTTWIETRRTLGLLNHSQVRHVVGAYRYEVKENRLPVEITQYVVQVANDLERATRLSLDPKDGQRRYAERGSCSEPSSSARTSTSLHRADSRGSSESSTAEEDENDFDDEATVVSTVARSVSSGSREMLQEQQEGWSQLSETRDSRMWIPFVIPSNLAARGVRVERVYVPYVPDDLLQVL
ncbi:hypothetical protein BGZ70_005043 [Mortierella alpina]|uniref:Dilute domain-containing protein n=1 Tax=Mortierella alpina TaxID=64518 RepID=A0A9P6J9D7_MORAP|nr:hypothetical protein BGZ70_005043 [Mortierella alpina]